MAEKVLFELVSPEKILLSEEVDMVVVPGVEGNFGVLPKHAPLISLIRPGVIDVWNNGGITERIFVAGGFAEVTPARCTVLADEAMGIDALDRAQIQSAFTEAENKLTGAREAAARAEADEEAGTAVRQLEKEAAVAAAKLDALGTAGTH